MFVLYVVVLGAQKKTRSNEHFLRFLRLFFWLTDWLTDWLANWLTEVCSSICQKRPRTVMFQTRTRRTWALKWDNVGSGQSSVVRPKLPPRSIFCRRAKNCADRGSVRWCAVTCYFHGKPQNYISCDDLLPQVHLYETDNGYMDKVTFRDIMSRVFIPFVERKRWELDLHMELKSKKRQWYSNKSW